MNLVLLYIFDISFKSPSFLGEKFFNFIFSSPLFRVLKAYIFLIVTYGCDYCMATIIQIIKKSFIFFCFLSKNKKYLQNRRGNFRVSSLGIESSFRGNWHQHNVLGYDITGCRASQGPSLHHSG